MESLGSLVLSIGPRRRGAPDSIREAVEAVVEAPAVTVMSQQLADTDIIDRLAELRSELGARASLRVLVERDYLTERSPLGASSIWNAGGDNESNRECLMALLRGDIDVRYDHIRGDLLHVNVAINTGAGQESVCLTSANLSSSSLDRHLNWAMRIDSAEVARSCEQAVDSAWDGDFRDVVVDTPVGDHGTLRISADGNTTRTFTTAVESATSSVHLAFFNISRPALGTQALMDAASRGIAVQGVVDADQGALAWDGTVHLRESGADVRYYPGARTGAVGRMHHKMAVFDGTSVLLSTANLSKSAETGLEACLFIPNAGPIAAMVETEITRLHMAASQEPLPPVVI